MNHLTLPPLTEEKLVPKEAFLEIIKKGNSIKIGLPKETCLGENRICLSPDAVQILVQNGYDIIVEKGAGEGAFYSDLEYSEAGARIGSQNQVFSQNCILKINPPSEKEIDLIKNNSLIISLLQINLRDKNYFEQLAQKKINCISFEFIESEEQEKTLVRMISEIAGRTSILYASELLAHSKGLMIGGITGLRPTEVVILGAGIVGEYAAKTALGLGANIRVFDNSISKLTKIHNNIGSQIVTSTIDPKELSKSLRRADLVIGALPRLNSHPIITEEMVKLMKKGSVIIDLTSDFGNCIESTEVTDFNTPYIIKNGILHCGLPNLTAKNPRTTSKAISNFFLSYFLDFLEGENLENAVQKKSFLRKGFYVYKGKFTQKLVCDKFGLKYTDIQLLFL